MPNKAPTCPQCVTPLLRGLLIVPSYSLKDTIDAHVAALVQSGDEKWKPGTGEEHQRWSRLVE